MTPKFKLGRHFCTVPLPTKLHHPMFTRSEFIVLTNKQTNKQTPLKTSNVLRYATTLGTQLLAFLLMLETPARQVIFQQHGSSSWIKYITIANYPSVSLSSQGSIDRCRNRYTTLRLSEGVILVWAVIEVYRRFSQQHTVFLRYAVSRLKFCLDSFVLYLCSYYWFVS